MEDRTNAIWKIFGFYLLIVLFVLFAGSASAQVTVIHYNAEWNNVNDVEWLKKLEDCDITKVDIVKKPKQQKKHKIVVVPTIIIFKDGEEVKRFQADISFTMKATKKDVQAVVDEILMDSF